MDLEIKKDLASNWFKMLQESICYRIDKLEKSGVKFKSTTWKRGSKKDEGGGEYRILKNGKVFEKVGVNFSKVYGKFPKQFQKKNSWCSQRTKILGIRYFCGYAYEKSFNPCYAL